MPSQTCLIPISVPAHNFVSADCLSGWNCGPQTDLFECCCSVRIHQLQVTTSHCFYCKCCFVVFVFFQDEQSAYSKRLQNKWRIQCATSFLSESSLTGCCLFLAHLSVFQLFDKEDRGSLSAEELSDLMGALLGVPQHDTAELYTQASDQGRLTEGERLMHQPPWEFSLI